MTSAALISDLAIVEAGVKLGSGVKIWEHAKIRAGAVIGSNVVIGQGVYVGPGVIIGDNCKIQNNAQLFEPCVLGDGVFVGPGAILTNDKNPRAVNSDGSLKTLSDWSPQGVIVDDGASLGAGSICVAPVQIGSFAMIAAGAVVVKDVEPGDTVAGVPAKSLKPGLSR